MTNDQCEQVVEEIWGWGYKEHEHREMVNSWQGFGRTVEAMADNNNIIIDAAGKHFIDYMLGRTSKEQLWGRTHLAALEAIKNNSK